MQSAGSALIAAQPLLPVYVSISGLKPMTEHSLWRFSRAIHLALNDNSTSDLESILDDNIEWTIYGPIDMFGFFGTHRGKPAVLGVVRKIADTIRLVRFDREAVMLGDDTAASLMRYSLTAKDSDQSISVRLAHFAQFKAGRLSNMRVIVDTFDLVEQALGRPIHLPKIA
jgi:ketosteroid isomerase-like protein